MALQMVPMGKERMMMALQMVPMGMDWWIVDEAGTMWATLPAFPAPEGETQPAFEARQQHVKERAEAVLVAFTEPTRGYSGSSIEQRLTTMMKKVTKMTGPTALRGYVP